MPVGLPRHQAISPANLGLEDFNPLSASFYIIYSSFADAPFLLQNRLVTSSLIPN